MNTQLETIRQQISRVEAACGGQPYENQIFAYHPPCACGQERCPWCAECYCDGDAYHYFINGERVNLAAYKFTAQVRFEQARLSRDPSRMLRLDEGMNIIHRPNCWFCKTGPKQQGGGPGRAAPNLWFKPWRVGVYWSGQRLQVWVGSTQVAAAELSAQRWERMVRECLRSKETGIDV